MLKVQVGKSTTGFLYAKSQTDLIHTEVPASRQVRGRWLSEALRMLVDACLLDDPKWYAPLSEALAPRPGECILDCGPGSALRALYYANRFPEAKFTAVEFDRRRIARAFKRSSSMSLPNYKAMTFEDARRVPFSASQFDKAMLVLNLHGLEPADKIKNLRELRRIVRRGGIVLAADIDQPKASREDVILRVTQLLYGAEATRSHTSGTWPKFLSEAGFTGARRLSEHPIWIGRMALVRSRKQ
ncbi:class I SAM-dependent methyltransferase [Methylobacterium nonmethylotrophicum]|uniref:Class I SAM-dependent methyltransferase n=1 Tax=Methylobacterium nonmethylotrophicum TaxID=1141884 RepID=A0A4Z0NCI7_9HYPH|nr:class I SAM-dependent methyltransferase [Methylobacterium nonmethylotrophicum]TGD92002.1 class I SAM-dependent methyltransferase [Methylobacterium nonmethylotrophicum]